MYVFPSLSWVCELLLYDFVSSYIRIYAFEDCYTNEKFTFDGFNEVYFKQRFVHVTRLKLKQVIQSTIIFVNTDTKR